MPRGMCSLNTSSYFAQPVSKIARFLLLAGEDCKTNRHVWKASSGNSGTEQFEMAPLGNSKAWNQPISSTG